MQSSFSIKQNGWLVIALQAVIIAMFAGLLFSRALLSVCMVAFVLLSFMATRPVKKIKAFFSSYFFLSMAFLFLVVAITGFWSSDQQKWMDVMRIKLPLIILPFCFAGFRMFTAEHWRKIMFVFIWIVVAGVLWSCWWYLQDMKTAQAGYLKAGVLKTPLGQDHIRFSLLIALAIITSGYLLAVLSNNPFRKAIFFAIPVLVVYLHLLAVRTGLLVFYLSTLIFVFWYLLKTKRPKAVVLLVLLVLLPVMAFIYLPTFKNRLYYIRYDFSLLQKNDYTPGSNDGNRLLSIRAGWESLQTHPLIGVGFGDVRNETDGWYNTHYPGMNKLDKILPSSEWMIHGAAAGWPGLVIFSLCMLSAFFVPQLKKQIAWRLINLSFLLSYLFDIGLEVQYGVFMHAFLILAWHNWLTTENSQ